MTRPAKQLPPSWSKQKKRAGKPAQLSLIDALYAPQTRQAVFIQEYTMAARNCKFLRYRLQYSSAKRGEKLAAVVALSDILETSAALLAAMSEKTTGFHHKTLEEYLQDLFIDKIENPPTEGASMRTLQHHYDNVSSKIRGMFLAYKDALRGQGRLMKKILQDLEQVKIILYRLSDAR